MYQSLVEVKEAVKNLVSLESGDYEKISVN